MYTAAGHVLTINGANKTAFVRMDGLDLAVVTEEDGRRRLKNKEDKESKKSWRVYGYPGDRKEENSWRDEEEEVDEEVHETRPKNNPVTTDADTQAAMSTTDAETQAATSTTDAAVQDGTNCQTPYDDMGRANNMGSNEGAVCQGDCDRDTDCAGQLQCFQRRGRDGSLGDDHVPGCTGTPHNNPTGDYDYCYDPRCNVRRERI